MRKNGHKTAIGALVLLMVAALVPMAMAGAQTSGAPALFTAAGEGRTLYTAPAHVARHRLVNVDMGTLFGPDGRALGKAALPSVALDLQGTTGDRGTSTQAGASMLTTVDGAICFVGIMAFEPQNKSPRRYPLTQQDAVPSR